MALRTRKFQRWCDRLESIVSITPYGSKNKEEQVQSCIFLLRFLRKQNNFIIVWKFYQV